MKTVLIIGAVLIAAGGLYLAFNKPAPTPVNPEEDGLTSAFMSFVSEHGKNYHSEAEYNMRLAVFKKNMALIAEGNAKNAGYTLAPNHLTDLTDEEFTAMQGFRKEVRDPAGYKCEQSLCTLPTNEVPETINW